VLLGKSMLTHSHEKSLEKTRVIREEGRSNTQQPSITLDSLTQKIPTHDTYRDLPWQSPCLPRALQGLQDAEGNPREPTEEDWTNWAQEVAQSLEAAGLNKEAEGVRLGRITGCELIFASGLTQPSAPSKNPEFSAHDILGGDGKPRCIVERLLYIAPLSVAQSLEALDAAGITHVINLTGFQEEEAEAAADKSRPPTSMTNNSKNSKGPAPEHPNLFPDRFNEDDGTYLHICLPPDEIDNEEMVSLSVDQDTNIRVYCNEFNQFINASRNKKSFGGALIHDNDSSSKACMVAMAYLIQFEMKTFNEAYAIVMENKIDAHPHRSWLVQLMRLAEQNHGLSPTGKARKAANRAGSWGERWEPRASADGEPSEGFVGVEVPTKENPLYLADLRALGVRVSLC